MTNQKIVNEEDYQIEFDFAEPFQLQMTGSCDPDDDESRMNSHLYDY